MEFIDLKKQYSTLKKEIDASIQNVLNNCNFILGEEVSLLEAELAQYVGAKYCITCANGTDALTLALRAIDLKPNDVVFVPTFTFFATAEVVSLNGGICKFVNVDKRTFNLDCSQLEKSIAEIIAEGKYQPKAIIAVDLFGQCAEYSQIEAICKKYNLLLIEDGAQGFGGSIDNRRACSFGDIATTSFFPAKPLGCYGDGGAIFTNNEKYAELIKSLRFHGKGSDKYDNIRIGYNSRLDTIQAAVLRVKLKAFSEYELERRQEIAKFYDEGLRKTVSIPFLHQGYKSSYAQYSIMLNTETERNVLQQKLKEQNIPSMIYYPKCMHEQTAYNDYGFATDDLKESAEICKKILSLPMHPYLTDAQVQQVIQAVIFGMGCI